MSTSVAPRLRDTKTVAAMLNVSMHTLRRLAAEGVIQPVKFGEHGKLRFRVADVETLISGEKPPMKCEAALQGRLANAISIVPKRSAGRGRRPMAPAEFRMQFKRSG